MAGIKVWKLKKLYFEYGLVVKTRTIEEWYGKSPLNLSIQNWIFDNDPEGKYILESSYEMG